MINSPHLFTAEEIDDLTTAGLMFEIEPNVYYWTDTGKQFFRQLLNLFKLKTPTETRLHEQLEREIEDANRVFAQPPVTLLRTAPAQPEINMGEFLKVIRQENFVVLDTETTGLEDGEIVQIAIVDKWGNTMLDTLVRPKLPIPASATAIHGITNEMVENAPAWVVVRQDVANILQGRHCVIYNAVYDRKMMHKSSERWGLPKTEWKEIAAFWCAMEMFAAVYGDWNEYRGNFKWQKLETAARYYKIESQGQAHTALADCLTTLAVCKAMADS